MRSALVPVATLGLCWGLAGCSGDAPRSVPPAPGSATPSVEATPGRAVTTELVTFEVPVDWEVITGDGWRDGAIDMISVHHLDTGEPTDLSTADAWLQDLHGALTTQVPTLTHLETGAGETVLVEYAAAAVEPVQHHAVIHVDLDGDLLTLDIGARERATTDRVRDQVLATLATAA